MFKKIRWLVPVLALASMPVFPQAPAKMLTLQEAVEIALSSDPWLTGSRQRQQALADEAVSVSSLPDPRVNLMAGNFPVDSLDINQEPMTQLSVGISQMFPRGDSLALAGRQKEQLSEREPLLRRDRRASVTATVTQLWLETYKAGESIGLIQQDRTLFENLADAARSSYSTAVGQSRQQDLIRAQLELTRLENRLTMLREQKEAAQRKLSEWLGFLADPVAGKAVSGDTEVALMRKLSSSTDTERDLYEWVSDHPALAALEKRIEAMETGVDLSRQKYRPEWGITAQYGYRDEDPAGRDRADLFSVGLTFDVPLFTERRQDREVSAAVSRAEALKTEKQLLARRMMAALETAIARWQRLGERTRLYEERLLPQMAEQAEASLNAYNNAEGDFAEAVRARIAELNAKIEALGVAVERRQVIARIRYLLTEAGGSQPGAAG